MTYFSKEIMFICEINFIKPEIEKRIKSLTQISRYTLFNNTRYLIKHLFDNIALFFLNFFEINILNFPPRFFFHQPVINIFSC